MSCKIVILNDDSRNLTLKAFAEKLLTAISEKCGMKFEIESYPVGVTANQQFGNPLPLEVIVKAKSAHAVLLGFVDFKYSHVICDKLAESLDLYTHISHIKSSSIDFYSVCDSMGGIYDGEKGFRQNDKFGREAFDTECYSELEIERVARIAYELAEIDDTKYPLDISDENTCSRTLTLIDMADRLNSSKLWRKIVTDINEDYPSISVNTMTISEAIKHFTTNTIEKQAAFSHGIALAPRLFSEIFTNFAINTTNCLQVPSAYLGDTALGMYCPEFILMPYPRGMVLAIALMLRHSFNLNSIAYELEQSIYRLQEKTYLTDDLLKIVLNDLKI